MYHYDIYVKVVYDNFNNKRKYDDDDDVERNESRSRNILSSHMH